MQNAILNKEEIRKENKEKRKLMTKSEVEKKSRTAAFHFLESEVYKNSQTVMLYYPIGNEADTAYILKKAFEDGKKVAFPVTNPQNNEITAVLADSETQFCKGAYSIPEPEEKRTIDKNMTDVIIVPGIAFDKKGARVGFGKGCYDRFLENIKAKKVGFCYDFQIKNEISADIFDIKMDYLVSESGMICCE